MREHKSADLGPLSPEQRREEAFQIRKRVAGYYRAHRIPVHQNNGDEHRYRELHYYANYSKGLPHDQHGEVKPDAYRALLAALESGRAEDFELVPAGVDLGKFVRFTDPQSGLAFDLEGSDPHQFAVPPCYQFDSAGEIGEIAELYWMALCRDVPFVEYGSNATIATAANDLSTFAQFDGPKDPTTGRVTPATIFRGTTPGDLAGPYLSQFMVWDIPYGSQKIPAMLAFGLPEQDFMTDEATYLAVQNGQAPTIVPQPVTSHVLQNGRAIANYVHIDELFQAYLNACLLLITPNTRGGFGAPISEGNPYFWSKNQGGFGTLGEPNYKTMVAEVATRALKAVWFQKWYVHRRLRPEAFGGRLHWHFTHNRQYDFHAAELAKLRNGVLNQSQIQSASYFLPMAFPEGCPTHPSYGAGHATVAGACVTVLKALFQEDVTFGQLGITPKQPKADGTGFEDYTGSDAAGLTVGGELNKLATNVGLARNFGGVHWRSDFTASVRLGEEVALYFLKDYVETYNEHVQFEITRVDGTKVTVQNGFFSVKPPERNTGSAPNLQNAAPGKP